MVLENWLEFDMNLLVFHLKIIAHDSLLRNIGSFLGDLSPLIVNFDDRIAPIS